MFKVLTKLDLLKGNQQISMTPDDVKETAITTPFALYEFFQMPFVLRNAL